MCTVPPPKSMCLKLSNVRRCQTVERSERLRREHVTFSNGAMAIMQSGGCDNQFKRITFVLNEKGLTTNEKWQFIAKRLRKNDYSPVLGRRVVGTMRRIARRGHNKPVYELISGYEDLLISERRHKGKIFITLTNNVRL